MADVTRRMLDLLTLLQTKRRFTGAELVTRLGVSERTVRRDIDRLRDYGYPVDASPGPGGHYGLTAGRAIPPLIFEPDEVVAIMLALASTASADPGGPGSIGEATTRAYGKLDQVLPARLAASAATLRSGLEAEAFRAPSVNIASVMRIATAIHERQQLEFTYRRGDRSTRRRVEPHRQVHHLLRWYLVAWDLEREDWRVFRADRMSGVHVRTAGFEARAMPEDTALDLVKAGVTRSSRQTVVVVEASADDVAAALPFEAMEFERLTPNRTRVTFHCEDWHWLLLNISHVDRPFTIEEPREWREEIEKFPAKVVGRG
ncbi:helix-turn-helix transcriptional regulator [Brevibacterium casei]|uniref:HTH domain n=1 Tax=Brevibacterium casei TaxID=33889 RepID=A0A449D7C6_9MICO|nr:WYL domain-containing protein [Brevibacterium casei]VEW13396.1 HTH domain [Brevibacterium casei]